jgi:hypothetical protein
MAENDFLSGLLGGVKDVGSSIYGGISGLLGGGEQAPAAAGQMPDSMSMLSPADQKRLMFSTLGQVGAALLAAGARQSPESRAQALAQLGKIGPGIEESIQRTAALQQQRIAAQRQNELFPLQKEQLLGQVNAQKVTQLGALSQLQNQAAALQSNISALERMGLGDQAKAQRDQLNMLQENIRKLQPLIGLSGGISAPAMAGPAAQQTLPTMAQPAVSLPPIGQQPAAQMQPEAFTGVPRPAPITGIELPPPAQTIAAPAGPAAPVLAAPGFISQLQMAEEPAAPPIAAPAPVPPAPLSQFEQWSKQNFPDLSTSRVLAELKAKNMNLDAVAPDLLKLQDKAKEQSLTLQKDFRAEMDKKVPGFADRQTAFLTMKDLSKEGAGASDIALVLSLMKVYDPGSTVTGSEAATAQNAAGVTESLRATYNNILGGGKLTDKARQDLVRAAEVRCNREMDTYGKTAQDFERLAKQADIDPKNVVLDARNPELLAAREFDLKRDAASAAQTPQSINMITNMEQLRTIKPEKLSASAKKAYDQKLIQIEENMTKPYQPAYAAPSTMGGVSAISQTMPQMGAPAFSQIPVNIPRNPSIRKTLDEYYAAGGLLR